MYASFARFEYHDWDVLANLIRGGDSLICQPNNVEMELRGTITSPNSWNMVLTMMALVHYANMKSSNRVYSLRRICFLLIWFNESFTNICFSHPRRLLIDFCATQTT